MIRIKRLLAIIICVAIFGLNLPFVPGAVYADVENGIISVENAIDYESAEDALKNGWSLGSKAGEHISITLDNAENLKISSIKQTSLTASGKANAVFDNAIFKLPAGPVSIDEANNTRIISEDGKYGGNVQVDVKASYVVSPTGATYVTSPSGTEVKLNAPFYNLYIGNDETVNYSGKNYNKYAVRYLIRSGQVLMLNHDTEASNTLFNSKGKTISATKTPAETFTLSSVFDFTDDSTAEVTAYGTLASGSKSDTASGSSLTKACYESSINYVDRLVFTVMQRMSTDAHITVENITVTTFDPDFGAATTDMLSILPDRLDVENIKLVDESEITLPVIDGVTWTSTNEEVFDVNGNKAIVIRSDEGDKTASIKANFTTDGFNYSKEYIMTVKKADKTVAFYLDGQIYATQNVVENGKATYQSAPEVDHKTFDGWYTEEEVLYDFNTAVTESFNLYGKYSDKVYKVEFVDENGDNVAEATGIFGATVSVEDIPQIPEKANYTAINWVIKGTETVFDENTKITGDMVIVPLYKEGVLKKVDVIFMVDGVKYDKQTVYQTHNVIAPEKPVKGNYTFEYWEKDGVKFDFATPITEETTLIAKFSPNPYYVSFYMDNTFEELISKESRLYNQAYGELPENPAKASHKFLGWKLEDGSLFTEETVIMGETKVYAEWESKVKTILNEDFTKYTSLDGHNVVFTTSGSAVMASLDNGVKFEFVNPVVTDRKFNSLLTGKFKIPYGEYDSKNRTQVFKANLPGDYAIKVVMDHNMEGTYTTEDGVEVSNPWGTYSTGIAKSSSSFSSLLSNRLFYNNLQSYNSSSIDTNSFNDKGTIGSSISYKIPDDGDFEVTIRYNSYTAEASMYTNVSDRVAKGSPALALDYVDAINISYMGCTKLGSYTTIKSLEVIQYDDYADDPNNIEALSIINSLPDYVVENPSYVTGKVNIPQIPDVTWESSNEDILSSKTGECNVWYDDEEVTLTAVVNIGNFIYKKEYYLTLKSEDTEVAHKVIADKIFTSEGDIENWTFANVSDKTIAEYSVDANGLTVKKIMDPIDPTTRYETKRYFAFYDLYSTYSANDKTLTEIKEYNGVYDVEFDISSNVTSEIPMNIALGYRKDNSFYSNLTLKISNTGAVFTYPTSAETVATEKITLSSDSKIRFRVDHKLGEVSIFVDGVLATPRCKYYNLIGDNAMINAIKIEVDENNNVRDFVTIKNVRVSKVIERTIPGLSDVISAAEALGISVITDTPDAVSKTIKVLPTEIGNYDIVWKSSSNQINVDTYEVFHETEAKNVTLYAEISDNSGKYPITVRKSFALTIRKASSDAELGETNINNLGRITNQPYDNIRYDLNLPIADNIKWTSSNTALISNDGKLNMNATVKTPTEVVMTATSNGSKKDYKLVVAKRTPQQNVEFNSSLTKLSADVIISYNYVNAETEGTLNIVDENNKVIVSMISTTDGFYFDYINSDLKEFTDANAKVKIVIMPDVNKLAIYVNDALVVDYANFKTKADFVAGIVSDIDVTDIKYTIDKYGALSVNLDNVDYFGNIINNYLNASTVLPVDVVTNAVVTWESSNEAVLKNNGDVITPEKLTFVDLSFKLADATDESIFIDAKYEIAVDCDPSKSVIGGIIPSAEFSDAVYLPKHISDNNADTVYKAFNTLFRDTELVFNLGQTRIFNGIYILTSQAEMEEYDIYVSNDGKNWTKHVSGNMKDKLYSYENIEKATTSYIKFVVKKCSSKEVGIRELKLYFHGSADELVWMDINDVIVPATAESNKISLPVTGENGTKFTWKSSNTSVIDTFGNVNRPSNPMTVTLTVSAPLTNGEATKSFEVYGDTKTVSGPSVVGGGGGGGGGSVSGGATPAPTIGVNTDATYEDELPKFEDTTVGYKEYNDVKETDWYYDAVTKLTSKGIVSGDGTGSFSPSNNVTREQFVKMILEATEVEVSVGDVTFGDVTSGAWYENYIATAVSNGIINGVGDGKFGVGTNISRQDMAVLIERVLNFKNIEVEKAESAPFADESSVADYAKDAVANMKAIGLIKGYNNNYNPKDNLTRAEAATVISSLLELLVK